MTSLQENKTNQNPVINSKVGFLCAVFLENLFLKNPEENPIG